MNKNEFNKIIDIFSIEDLDYKAVVMRMIKFNPSMFLALYEERFYEPEISEAEHMEALRDLLGRYVFREDKIHAIKAVREYCTKNKFNKYIGLKDAKDLVEDLKGWRYNGI